MVDARAEHVGSLLRPAGAARRAREAHAAGDLSDAALKAAEDEAVRDVVAMQEDVGLPVVNDGELRRESFQSELTASVDGFSGREHRRLAVGLVALRRARRQGGGRGRSRWR